MNGQTPPKELNDFMLPSGLETVPDMLAIGTQESCSERSEWEAALQETLGPSHVLLTSTSLGTLHLALFVRRDLIWFCSVPEDSYFSTRPGTAFRTKGAVALAIMLFGTSFLFVTAHLTAHQEKVKERINDIKRIVRNLDLPKDLPTRHKSKGTFPRKLGYQISIRQIATFFSFLFPSIFQTLRRISTAFSGAAISTSGYPSPGRKLSSG